MNNHQFEKLLNFKLRLKYKDEGNGLLQKLVKFLLSSFFGENTRQDIIQKYKRKSKYVERVLHYLSLSKREYIRKLKQDECLEC